MLLYVGMISRWGIVLTSEKKTVHVIYSGLVQGVGFRFTARDLANRNKVYGWVRNCVDGTVELLVYGEGKNVEIFLSELQQQFVLQIMNVRREDVVTSETYDAFHVMFQHSHE